MNLVLMYAVLIIAVMVSACKKEDIKHNPNPGENPDGIYKVKVKAAITIGDIMYDSIPASLQVISWDNNDVMHERQINLAAGTNEVSLPKAHRKYQLKLSKWGISDEMSFTKSQVPEGTLIDLGGSKAAKKIQREEGFVFAAGSYRLDNKTIYTYNIRGGIQRIDYYEKRPQHSDLKAYQSDVFVYSGNRVIKINRLDEFDSQTGVTDFTYNAQGKVTNIHQTNDDQETGAAVEYSSAGATTDIEIFYLFNNGNSMVYFMKIKKGDKVEDAATTSLNKSESGVYGYDFNINPFAHMNMPNLFLSNISKNNMVSQQKSYFGNIPSGEPYKFEYSYDTEGYPTELIRSYKSYTTGEHLYDTKTVYTY